MLNTGRLLIGRLVTPLLVCGALFLAACGSGTRAATVGAPAPLTPLETPLVTPASATKIRLAPPATPSITPTAEALVPPPSTPSPQPSKVAPGPVPQSYAALLEKAQQNGSVRIIVGLKVPFVPEGELPNEAAVVAQRTAIAAAQDALLRRLSGHNVQNVSRFEYTPFIAMEVDAAALRILSADPEVSSIQEDSLSAPALVGPNS